MKSGITTLCGAAVMLAGCSQAASDNSNSADGDNVVTALLNGNDSKDTPCQGAYSNLPDFNANQGDNRNGVWVAISGNSWRYRDLGEADGRGANDEHGVINDIDAKGTITFKGDAGIVYQVQCTGKAAKMDVFIPNPTVEHAGQHTTVRYDLAAVSEDMDALAKRWRKQSGAGHRGETPEQANIARLQANQCWGFWRVVGEDSAITVDLSAAKDGTGLVHWVDPAEGEDGADDWGSWTGAANTAHFKLPALDNTVTSFELRCSGSHAVMISGDNEVDRQTYRLARAK